MEAETFNVGTFCCCETVRGIISVTNKYYLNKYYTIHSVKLKFPPAQVFTKKSKSYKILTQQNVNKCLFLYKKAVNKCFPLSHMSSLTKDSLGTNHMTI